MIPARLRARYMNSRTVAVLGAALALVAIVLAYLGRDTRTIEGVQRDRDRAPAVSGAAAAQSSPATETPAANALAANAPAAEAAAAPERQSALARGIAERKARDDAACQGGDAEACANLRAVVRTRQDYVACARDDADACWRVLNSLRSPDQRAEMRDRCEGGDTRACVMLSNFHLNIDPDTQRVAEYQALALGQLRADPRPERREAAAAIETELRTLDSGQK